ncbi:MAG: methyltransferase domain-containing protein [Ruminococcaceae bacterium]|jgi:ubiquinone/menaquinone biosynthesis C-methylase UbiE|nr:methyltransferase domain-containing protein [Oscillospiraceae bacterium]
MKSKKIAPWELLQKKMTWEQLKQIHGKKVLDFGSGNGVTASHFAIDNEVVAVEPDENMLQNRCTENNYVQIKGSVEELENFEDESFDAILCHNVFEYVRDRTEIVKEFSRILRSKGYLSVIKHNRAGRVMQMAVLLNNFEHANELLEGKNGHAQKFGTIHYYEDQELLSWFHDFKLEKVLGMRTFWDLQQNQEVQKDTAWQEQMLKIELSVSELEEYKAIAFFHHVILSKES